MDLFEEKKFIKNVPVLICRKTTDTKKALVFLSHGFRSNKEFFKDKEYLRNLAEMGYYTVALDNRFHGERLGASLASTIIDSQGKVNLLALKKVI